MYPCLESHVAHKMIPGPQESAEEWPLGLHLGSFRPQFRRNFGIKIGHYTPEYPSIEA